MNSVTVVGLEARTTIRGVAIEKFQNILNQIANTIATLKYGTWDIITIVVITAAEAAGCVSVRSQKL